ncbi:LOW QUALITY PROTEIN: uncharacterized protein LOC134333871 [Trichomycterus rosablanca]|uniref:LOW QUALITY PROTEIN: uncharacterized protein LOC134333871 n=1 Tax=Trichomycterus rosablanca TaxID=2290929 RepID=UPI002F34FC87
MVTLLHCDTLKHIYPAFFKATSHPDITLSIFVAGYFQAVTQGLLSAVWEPSYFCKKQGFSRLITGTPSAQTAAIRMFQKTGFVQTSCHNCTLNVKYRLFRIAKITIL